MKRKRQPIYGVKVSHAESLTKPGPRHQLLIANVEPESPGRRAEFRAETG